VIDLRSDTVTKPTKEMIDAMLKAEVGDDGYKEDPTVNKLEEIASTILEKEAALFMPSGTMANQVAIKTHTNLGDEIIAESNSHILTSEMGAPAIISSVLIRTAQSIKGVLDPKSVEELIRDQDNVPKTSLLCIENTHNKEGGTVTSLERIKGLAKLAKAHNIATHMDGARIFNASIALGVKAADLVSEVDSVMFCLSKALSAPAGSILLGKKEFIDKARINRRLLGGQMRQIGFLAAAGIIALEQMIDRLEEDHQKAKKLAEGLMNINKINLDYDRVQTNIVIFDISPLGVGSKRFLQELEDHGIKAFPFSNNIIRMVPTRHTTNSDIERTIKAVKEITKQI